MRPDRSLPPKYFEAMFQGDADPWGLESRTYEAAKFADTVRSLGERQYDSGFEVGCAGGSLTSRLAPLCQSLLAVDVSETALDRARQRCGHLPQVRFEQMIFPQDQPEGLKPDLVVLSEVAYYWDDADLARAADWLRSALAPGGDLLLVHWTGETDYPQTGDGAVESLAKGLGGRVSILAARREPQYRLDLWRAT